jgi:1-acyl-sn-glycerol-3-phosphate acyltransferase
MIQALLATVLWVGIKAVTGVRALPEGLLGDDAGVLFANHSSHFDTLVVWAAVDRHTRQRLRPVAARDYWGRPGPLGWFGRHVLNVLLIDREGGGDPVAEMVAALDRGELLLLFPEGTRTPAGELGRFRGGLFRIAEERPRVPLHPVFLDNPGRALPKGELVPVPMLCAVQVGPPLARRFGEDRSSFLTRSQEAVRALAPTSFHEEAA